MKNKIGILSRGIDMSLSNKILILSSLWGKRMCDMLSIRIKVKFYYLWGFIKTI